MKAALDKVGSFGALVAAAACPVCFPKLALIGALFGLGGLAAYEAQLAVVAQALVAVAVVGQALAYRRHRSRRLLGLAIAGSVAFFTGLYAYEPLAYAGLAALVAASMADTLGRLLRKPPGRSTLTCPACGDRRDEMMPTDACQFFYECRACGKLLRPKPGDCCVFCSYGSVRCPPRQADSIPG